MTTRYLEPVIGLEVHAQVKTRSKMYCGCSADYAGAEPNTHVCATCAGMPGALPVINRAAVQATITTALALGCDVPARSKFDRKNYPYPDLPKGYQITQYDMPIGQRGRLVYGLEGVEHACGIVRVHLEEDTGKSVHTEVEGHSASLIDYNRCGVPLMEIVSEPELHSPAAAREYFATLRQVLMYLGVCDGNLQEGSMRADVNVSLRDESGAFGTKVEIKNLNSFRAVQRALEYEIERQRTCIEAGERIVQETRGWLEREEVTVSQRTKEYAHDYRYFPEPDLPPLVFNEAMLQEFRTQLPELPAERRARFERELGLRAESAAILTAERPLADYFEGAVAAAPDVAPSEMAKWITGDVARLLHEAGETVETTQLSPRGVARTVELLENGAISGKAAKQVLEEIFTTGEDPDAVVERLDLKQITDRGAIAELAERVLAENEPLVEKYRQGKGNLLQALAGKVIAASNKKAAPEIVQAVLREHLDSPAGGDDTAK